MSAIAQETVALLRTVTIFRDLSEADLARIAQTAVPRRFEADETVFREGDDGDSCYVISAGRVRAVRQHADGRTIMLATFGPREFFGELALLDRERRSATVEAVEETEVVAILGADLRRLLRADPELALGMLAALGRRLRETNERLARQSFQTVQSRVAAALSQLAAQARAHGQEGPVVELSATHAQIAQLAGSARESASRFLAQLARDGVISQGRGRVTVHDPDRLDRYVF